MFVFSFKFIGRIPFGEIRPIPVRTPKRQIRRVKPLTMVYTDDAMINFVDEREKISSEKKKKAEAKKKQPKISVYRRGIQGNPKL